MSHKVNSQNFRDTDSNAVRQALGNSGGLDQMVESTHTACGSTLTPCARFAQRVRHDDCRLFHLLKGFAKDLALTAQHFGQLCLALVSFGRRRFKKSLPDGATGLP
jgi:hypothetical protein